jgi:hypothetical protein
MTPENKQNLIRRALGETRRTANRLEIVVGKIIFNAIDIPLKTITGTKEPKTRK